MIVYTVGHSTRTLEELLDLLSHHGIAGIADALVARGWTVRHVTGPGNAAAHRLTPFSRLEGERIVYDGSARSARAD